MERGTLFYDGDCAMCSASMRWLGRRDRFDRLRFAPLGGQTFLQHIPEPTRSELPDSVVLLEPGGAVHVRSDAVVRALALLPRPWPWIGGAMRIVPRPIRDLGYRAVARVRRLVPAPPACPTPPESLRARLLP